MMGCRDHLGVFGCKDRQVRLAASTRRHGERWSSDTEGADCEQMNHTGGFMLQTSIPPLRNEPVIPRTKHTPAYVAIAARGFCSVYVLPCL